MLLVVFTGKLSAVNALVMSNILKCTHQNKSRFAADREDAYSISGHSRSQPFRKEQIGCNNFWMLIFGLPNKQSKKKSPAIK